MMPGFGDPGGETVSQIGDYEKIADAYGEALSHRRVRSHAVSSHSARRAGTATDR